MAHLGHSKFEDLVGRSDLLNEDSAQLTRIVKTKGVSLSGFFSSIPDSKGDRDFSVPLLSKVVDSRGL